MQSNSVNSTEYGQSTSSGATETVTVGLNPNGTQTAAIGGTKSTGDVLTILVCDAGLSGGQESVSYTVLSADTLATIASGIASAINADSALSAIGVTATAVSTVVNIKSASTNATTYTQSVSSGATETVALTPGMSVIGDTCNNLNQLIARSSAGAVHFQGSTNKPVKSVGFNSSQVNIQDSRPVQTITYTTNFNVGEAVPTTPGVTSFFLNLPLSAGDVLSITAHNALLPGGQETATYVVESGDSYADMAANLATAINNDSNLQTLGLSAAGTGTIPPLPNPYLGISVLSPTYTGAASSGATEKVMVSQLVNGSSVVSIGGLPTAGDTVTITAHFPSLPSGQESVSYTVLSGDKLSDIAAALSTLINADTNLSALDIGSTANDASSAVLLTAERFTGKPVLSGNSATSVSAVDGDNNVKTNVYQTSVSNSPSSQNLIYDLNGNLTFDGTNTYLWDAENRLVQINYQGVENSSQFTYNAYGNIVNIVEIRGGATASTKQFVWASGVMKESRDGSGAVTTQYFGKGQTIGGTSYFYTNDLMGSVREMMSSAGSLVAEYTFDVYGRATKIQESLASDFQYAGYYMHAPSGLSLPVHRVYSANLGRWINREPRGESQGSNNLYAYVHNRPATFVDSEGTFDTGLVPGGTGTGISTGISTGIGTGAGGGTGILNSLRGPNITAILAGLSVENIVNMLRAWRTSSNWGDTNRCFSDYDECMRRASEGYQFRKDLKRCGPKQNNRRKELEQECYDEWRKCILGIGKNPPEFDEAMQELMNDMQNLPEQFQTDFEEALKQLEDEGWSPW